MSARVTHVIQSLSRGGAGRATVSLAQPGCTIISLTPADPLMRAEAVAAGATVLESGEARAALEAADVVIVHFWNTPELHELLRGGLPPVRLALWVHVAGDTAPQIVTRQVARLADAVAVTAAQSASLPVFEKQPLVVPAAPDPRRFAGAVATPHAGFRVGYVGNVDFVKMHPRYVELSAAAEVPGVRFVVCGSGESSAALAAQARRLEVEERMEFRGYVEEIAPVLSELDVFGYPLAPGSYATSDLALQEAMGAGVPPVVLASSAIHLLVEHGVTGLVARDEAEYPRAIEYLHANPGERLRLGANAREQARRRGPAEVAREWAQICEELLRRPKRSHPARLLTGAAAFVESLGETAPEFALSLFSASDEEAIEAERQIAAAPPALASPAGGGVLHYRRRYPDDGHLRLWAGLLFAAAGKHALAVAELKHARELGCDTPRVRDYLARSAEPIGAGKVVFTR